MRTASHIRSAALAPLALAAAFALAAAPAAAQDHSKDAVRPAPALAVMREVAKYRFQGGRREGLPAEVTVIDSAGQLVATYRLPGQGVARPMLVMQIDTDLILQAETDEGVLTLQLHGQNDPPADGAVSGRWTLGGRSGELRGRAK